MGRIDTAFEHLEVIALLVKDPIGALFFGHQAELELRQRRRFLAGPM